MKDWKNKNRIINSYVSGYIVNKEILNKAVIAFEMGSTKDHIVSAMENILGMDKHILNDPVLSHEDKSEVYERLLKKDGSE